jgi:hypothetical protein
MKPKAKCPTVKPTTDFVSSIDIGKLTQRGIDNIRAIKSANRNEGMIELLKAWDKAHPEPALFS